MQAATYEHVINSKFLTETLWTRKAGESVQLQQEHHTAMHAVHLFNGAAHVPFTTQLVLPENSESQPAVSQKVHAYIEDLAQRTALALGQNWTVQVALQETRD